MIATVATGKEPAWEVLPPEDPPRREPSSSASSRRTRLATAFGIAVVSDLLSIWLEFVPPLQWTLDLSTAFLLFLMLGRQWAILPGLVAEAIPGLAVVPAWVLVVLSIAIWGTVKPTGSR
jgi:hypothetical protein